MWTKTPEEMDWIDKGGKIMGEILDELAQKTKAGISTWQVDKWAEDRILEAGGKPAFKGYTAGGAIPFPATICASINQELVHGIPSKKVILKDGDIFTIDIGMEYPVKNSKFKKGFFTDTAITIPIGAIPAKTQELLRVTKEALEVGIKAVEINKSVASIGKAIEKYIKSQGKYGIVRDLVGHGVGHAVHEDPCVPNYYDPGLEDIMLVPGMVIAIEPMVALGTWRVKLYDDGWTIGMSDKSLSAHFEHTIIIEKNGPKVATRRPSEKL